jgi:hypothetical protein
VKLWAGGHKAVTVALTTCLAVGVVFVAQSAADDLAVGASTGDAIAPAGAIPADVASSDAMGSPQVQITLAPSGTVASSDATLAFGSDSGNGVECSLDGAAFAPCTSPQTYSGLDDGTHLFSVRLVSADGAAQPAHATWTVQNVMPCTGPDHAANFPVYSAGPSAGGLGVSEVIRNCVPPETDSAGRANYVSYLYGICPELADGTADACAPPLEVQTWPACERSLADYELAPGEPYPHEELGQLDGVPAYSFDDGTRVELYTGEATIVIFSAEPQLIDDAVALLQLEPTSQPPGEPTDAADDQGAQLPDPAPGALSGDLSCG